MHNMNSFKDLALARPPNLLPSCMRAVARGFGARSCSGKVLRDRPVHNSRWRIGRHVAHVGLEEASALVEALKVNRKWVGLGKGGGESPGIR